jgi:hypothetical protein
MNQTHSHKESKVLAFKQCKMFQNWSTDGRGINLYIMQCAMRTLYGELLPPKEYHRLCGTANLPEGLIQIYLLASFSESHFACIDIYLGLTYEGKRFSTNFLTQFISF